MRPVCTIGPTPTPPYLDYDSKGVILLHPRDFGVKSGSKPVEPAPNRIKSAPFHRSPLSLRLLVSCGLANCHLLIASCSVFKDPHLQPPGRRRTARNLS